MRERAARWDAIEKSQRDRLADTWRSVRADIAALLPEQRAEIRARADHYAGPLNPIAYSYFYRQVTGQHPPGIHQSRDTDHT